MSFVDLATIALHRRNEMEARINVFSEKCDHAITDINKLKTQAKNFVHQLNCDPADLKERFLNCMKNLDEFTYLITDFNLALTKLGSNNSIELTPVHDTSITALPARPSRICTPYSLIDVLTEPTPSTSTACPNQCPTAQPLRRKLSQQDQVLIAFSSPSPSSSSGSINVSKETTEKEVQCEFVEPKNATEVVTEASSPIKHFNLPAQTILSIDQEYSAKILSVDGVSFWVTTENYNELYNLLLEMSEYYKTNFMELTPNEVKSLTYCACYDHKRDKFFRGLFIRLNEESNANYVEVFLVDTGEVLVSSLVNVQPLPLKFCNYPPFARCCYLAGIEFLGCNEKEYIDKLENVLKQFINKHCIIIVDDNSSEALGVFVKMLPTGTFLNHLLIDQGLAYTIVDEKPEVKIERGSPELVEPDCDINDCPEYEDPLEAVTGYHNRDEMDICKHYKGGPEKTCFKGARCTKKHILKHPEGWTLDRVAVPGKCLTLPLPAPGTCLQVYVCHVAHYDRFYVQLPQETKKEEASSFGVVLPPSSLEALVRDMNSPAARMAYKPFTLAPALGELVAALYPADEKWYRARVISSTRVDQNIEVMYIDYGNTAWVLEDGVRQLAARHWALPAQAVSCALAGVRSRSQLSRDWANARALLTALISDKSISARVISREYDGLTLELFDNEGDNIAERFAESKLVELTEYAVCDDTNITQRVVVP